MTRTTRRPLVLMLSLLLLALGYLSGATAWATSTLDQHNDPPSEDFSKWAGAASVSYQSELAQTFTAGRTGSLDRLELPLALWVEPAAGELSIEIRTEEGISGPPLATAALPATSVPFQPVDDENQPLGDDLPWVDVSFDSPAQVTAGQRYAIVITTEDQPYVTWDLTDPWPVVAGGNYPGGETMYRWPQSSNPDWRYGWGGNEDFGFRTYVAAATDALKDGEADQFVTGGETVTTQGSATPESPLQSSIRVPEGVSGQLTVTPKTASTTSPGFALFGTELEIHAPASTAENPYEATFTLDASLLGDIPPGDVQVFRDGGAVADCTSPQHAVPDPCMASRSAAGDGSGDALITVRTSAFSTWSFGRVEYEVTGPFAPVNPHPTVNLAKAGSTIPVKFRLGADRGLAVFSAGYPQVRSMACTSGDSDGVEQTLTTSTSKLVFDEVSGTYNYQWKTDRSRTGCFELVLGFRDGEKLKSAYRLR
jgi:hypothetical protein